MTQYRDYGAVAGQTAPLVEVDVLSKSQVYQATHNGNERLSFMHRSFISFAFDNKLIEDFNLLAIIENNALQRNLYADFEDNVTDSEVWDGQIYWGSHYKANELSFTLFTDGMTEQQLDEFKHFFQPGKIGELILSEHPNRAIMARVGEVPEYSILPFEEKTTVRIAGKDYNTSTTMYKGRINLKFVMDDPFWYSRANLIDKIENNAVSGFWRDANGNLVHLLYDKDALKVMLEDGVPCAEMLYDLTIGEQSYIDLVDNPTNSRAGSNDEDSSAAVVDETRLPSSYLLGDSFIPYINTSEFSSEGSYVGVDIPNTENDPGARVGFGHCAYYTTSADNGLNYLHGDNNPIYFYYAGTAPCYPTLAFSLTPHIRGDNDGSDSNDKLKGYIDFPKNRYVDPKTPYNTITIECTEKQTFSFSTPGPLTGFNQAIEIFKSPNMVGVAWEDVRNAIRTNVKHWAPRQYACYIIDMVSESSLESATSFEKLGDCIAGMANFICGKDTENNNAPIIQPIQFVIDCEHGIAKGTFTYRTNSDYVEELEENVGDMVQSGYLVIKEKNVFDEDGYIRPWQSGKKYCHKLYADCSLQNIKLSYKYMYL